MLWAEHPTRLPATGSFQTHMQHALREAPLALLATDSLRACVLLDKAKRNTSLLATDL